jgi:uncharacterized protein
MATPLNESFDRVCTEENLTPVVAGSAASGKAFGGQSHAAGISGALPCGQPDKAHAPLLSYNEDDWNALHQDVYGENVFPIQVAFLLSEPGKDFTGGEFVLTEQRPRMQSRAEVVSLRQGDGVAFAVSHRPVQGTKGTYRVTLRHGVSRLRSGHRYTMGIIFHDGK